MLSITNASILLVALLSLSLHLFSWLRFHRFRRHASWPQSTPALLWGHMRVLHEAILGGPIDRHIDNVFGEMRARLGSPPAMFLDLWPVSYPTLVACSHEVAEQISKASKQFPYSVPKSPGMKSFENLIGAHSILTAEGEQWRALRKRFGPGFAHKHLITLLPCILDKTWDFLRHLDSYVRTGEQFQLGPLCEKLTFDIIGVVTMDLDFGAQQDRKRQSELIQLYSILAESCNEDHGRTWPWQWPGMVLRQRYSAYRLDSLIKESIKQRFSELSTLGVKKDSRCILALGLQDTRTLTPLILQQCCDQIKTFLFAGHDTTSIVLQWTFYELSRTPRVLAALREELNDLFGIDPDPRIVRGALLARGDELIQRMTYTSAVIKEILRLYPPAGSARMAPRGSKTMLSLPGHREVCIDGLVVYNSATIIQRDERVYGSTANEFVPERWLETAGTTEKQITGDSQSREEGGGIPPGAWRPFERGPRNCIGQELANIELRVILACTVRRYNFMKVGMGELARDGHGRPILNAKGQYEVKSELYNTRRVTAKPVDGTAMTVEFHNEAFGMLM
ncbi:cytochrome P450 [Thozetella sp. PMI_491]|nr:cytochrome P450 [Thozetella sp. PMI_491]